MSTTKENEMHVMTYYAIVSEGRRYIELLVRRENGRQVSQEPTGTTYKSFREASAAIGSKNAGK